MADDSERAPEIFHLREPHPLLKAVNFRSALDVGTSEWGKCRGLSVYFANSLSVM